MGSVYNDAVVVLFNRQQNVGMNENQLEMISIADEAIKNRFLASVNKFIKMDSEATRTDFVDVEITMDSGTKP